MSREIKFRAWDSINKEMVYSRYEPFNSLKEGDILNRYETVMQFTEMKDKNNKEIYEGDIVEIKNSFKAIIIIGNYQYYFTVERIGLRNIRFNEFRKQNEIEVIGNIHSTPELLTPKQ